MEAREIAKKIGKTLSDPKLTEMFEKCFLSTLHTTTRKLEDGSYFVFTGDIPAMWLRDSAAQVRHYISFAAYCEELADLIKGVISNQVKYILIDPYANAFNADPNSCGHTDDKTLQNPHVWERKYEIDSLCYPVWLAYLFWQETKDSSIFNQGFQQALWSILEVWKKEQQHETMSEYRFERNNCPVTDTLSRQGKGSVTEYTGLLWSGFRPSDDACEYGYLIPANMFAYVVLGYMAQIGREIYKDEKMTEIALGLQKEIGEGIAQYGLAKHDEYGLIYAYEVDGRGNQKLMDDANVPSLLSLPYLGYCRQDDPIYQNTRAFILSRNNPYYFEGKYAKGVGSPHTPTGYVWPIGMIMQALTAIEQEEANKLLNMLITSDGGSGCMHESLDPDRPEKYTRDWFAWANSLCAYLILKRFLPKGYLTFLKGCEMGNEN